MALYPTSSYISIDIVKYFIEKVNDIAKDPVDNTGQRPIHYAAANGNLEIMKYFIEKVDGIEKEPKTFLGFYPIHWSASYGGLETTKYLIAKINETHPKNNYGKTPLDFARENIRIEVVKFLECYHSGIISIKFIEK